MLLLLTSMEMLLMRIEKAKKLGGGCEREGRRGSCGGDGKEQGRSEGGLLRRKTCAMESIHDEGFEQGGGLEFAATMMSEARRARRDC